MAEESSRGPLVALLIVGLAFGVVFLGIRLDAVNEELDAVGKKRDRVATQAQEAARLAGGLEVSLEAARRDLRVKAEQEALALDGLERALERARGELADAEARREKLRGELERTRSERDRAEAGRIDAVDRLEAVEAALILRERDLAAVRAELKRLREPTAVDVERRRLARDDVRVRADAIRNLGELREEEGAWDALRDGFRTSRDLPEALAALRAAGDEGGRKMARAEASNEAVVVRCAAATVLTDADLLKPMLGDASAPVRAAAARRIGEIRLADAGDALQALRGDEDPAVRAAVALALARLGRWEPLGPMMADADPRVARAALLGWVEGGRPVPGGLRRSPALGEAMALATLLSD